MLTMYTKTQLLTAGHGDSAEAQRWRATAELVRANNRRTASWQAIVDLATLCDTIADTQTELHNYNAPGAERDRRAVTETVTAPTIRSAKLTNLLTALLQKYRPRHKTPVAKTAIIIQRWKDGTRHTLTVTYYNERAIDFYLRRKQTLKVYRYCQAFIDPTIFTLAHSAAGVAVSCTVRGLERVKAKSTDKLKIDSRYKYMRRLEAEVYALPVSDSFGLKSAEVGQDAADLFNASLLAAYETAPQHGTGGVITDSTALLAMHTVGVKAAQAVIDSWRKAARIGHKATEAFIDEQTAQHVTPVPDSVEALCELSGCTARQVTAVRQLVTGQQPDTPQEYRQRATHIARAGEKIKAYCRTAKSVEEVPQTAKELRQVIRLASAIAHNLQK